MSPFQLKPVAPITDYRVRVSLADRLANVLFVAVNKQRGKAIKQDVEPKADRPLDPVDPGQVQPFELEEDTSD